MAYMLGLLKAFAPNQKEYPTIEESERIKLYEKINQSLNNLTPVFTTQTERNLIRRIYKETEQNNVNNLTRTEAYLRFFSKHKEIHWAFLAHMVSRNGGYSMTD